MAWIRIQRRLARAARAYLERSNLGISVPGRIYLSWLLTKAAIRVVSERQHYDESALTGADDAVWRLLSVAAESAGLEPGSGNLAGMLFFSVGSPLPRRRILARHLRAALRKLCPGFWPFCPVDIGQRSGSSPNKV